MTFTFTFTCMHLADTFIQSDLQCIQAIIFFCQYVSVDCKLVGQYDGSTESSTESKSPVCVFSKGFPRETARFSAESLGFLSEQLVG